MFSLWGKMFSWSSGFQKDPKGNFNQLSLQVTAKGKRGQEGMCSCWYADYSVPERSHSTGCYFLEEMFVPFGF
jgi:hypothetical protein